MRILIYTIGLLVSVSTLQTQAAEHKGFLVKTEFEYLGKKKSKAESTIIIDAKNKLWITLTEPKDGVALLGRIMSSDSKSIQMEYMVVDTNQKNAVIATPQVNALFGESARLEMGDKDDEKVIFSLLAKPTEYTVKK